MLHHSIGDVGDGHLGSWGFQQGGMGAVSDSIRRSAESFGCEIRTDARVKKVLTTGGRFAGVVLENGEELRAPLGVTCIHPKIAFLDLIGREELPADFVWDIERWRTRSGVVKINVAMSELPGLHRRPRQGAAGPPHRLGGAVLHAAVRGGGLPGLPHGPQGLRPAVRGRRDPHHARQEARARGRPRLLDVHASGCPTTGTSSRTATSSSSTPTGSSTSTRSSHRTSRPRSSTVRCSGRTTWSRSSG